MPPDWNKNKEDNKNSGRGNTQIECCGTRMRLIFTQKFLVENTSQFVPEIIKTWGRIICYIHVRADFFCPI